MQPDLDKISEHPQINSNDAKAKEEEKEEYDKYADRRAESSFNQQEALKKIFHICALAILILLAICLGFLILVRFFLIVLPTCRRWLGPDEIAEIDRAISYVVVGSVGSFVLKYYQNNIK